jgi:hypothetical protein
MIGFGAPKLKGRTELDKYVLFENRNSAYAVSDTIYIEAGNDEYGDDWQGHKRYEQTN